jgi:hypothetical protein
MNATNQQTETLEQAQQRADNAEQELARLKQQQEPASSQEVQPTNPEGVEALRADSMMAHLMESLEQGKDIGHYGRLVFAMVASHFLTEDEVINWLSRDNDFDAHRAAALLRQVEGRGYNPPRRDRILEWQREQDFPILPNTDDPDCGNVYKSLRFPPEVYEHIEAYQEEKSEAGV